jgi:hypothetical protein
VNTDPTMANVHKYLGWTLSDWDDFSERAAIMEYDGGLTRAEAEARAYECVNATVQERMLKASTPG